MLTLPPSIHVFLAAGPTDLRRSMDGLSGVVRQRMKLDPGSGHLFVFCNRRMDRLKVLVWDGGGFWVLYKRLEKGTFAWPPVHQTAVVEMRAAELMLLLSGVDLSRTRRRGWYEKVA